MTMDFDLTAPLSKAKVRRYLFALLLWGLAVYFFLPRFAAMKHALAVSRISDFLLSHFPLARNCSAIWGVGIC